VLALLGGSQAALGSSGETSPSFSFAYQSTTASGVVEFFYTASDNAHGVTTYTLSGFKFHTACTKTLTHVHKTIFLMRQPGKVHRHFSYAAHGISITGQLIGDINKPRITGTIRVAGVDCDGDHDGAVKFDVSS
jgi:hypothetical protein